jgi:hypothetical protein
VVVACVVAFVLGLATEANVGAQVTRSGDSGSSEWSCMTMYQRKAIRVYDRFSVCMRDAAGQFARDAFQQWCYVEYTSDALQAYGEYVSCMSFGRLWP